MKNFIVFLIFFCFIFLFQNNTLASIIIADNNPTSSTKYSTIQEAYENASDGDIIYLLASQIEYLRTNETLDIEKKITIFGNGFDLDKTQDQSNKCLLFNSRIYGKLIFHNGSDGSTIEGVGGNFSATIYASNITMKSNKISNIHIIPSINILLVNNYIYSIEMNDGNSSTHRPFELFALNNIIENIFSKTRVGALIFSNNIVKGYISNSSNLVKLFFSNNIILKSNLNCNNCIFRNNLFSTKHENIDSSTNIFHNPEDVFIDYENQNYYLKENSPAKGTGENGTDMGIYGGFHPFVDTGLPNLPIIYSLDSTIVTSHDLGLKVIIKAKSN